MSTEQPPPQVVDPVEEFARNLVEKHRAYLLKENGAAWEPRATWATDLGYECERRIVYHRVLPQLASGIDAELAGIFREGKNHEKDVRRVLDELGVELVEGQRNFLWEDLDVSGSIDGKVRVPGRAAKVTAEIKSTTGEPPASQEAWARSESPLMRRYYAQNQIYMLLTGDDVVLALFKSKITGAWKMIVVRLDYAHAETLLKKAERVRDAVKAWRKAYADEAAGQDPESVQSARTVADATLPPRIADRSECGSCPWRDSACHPGTAAVDPLLLSEDARLTAQLDRRAELAPLRKEYEKIHEHVRARFDLTAGKRFAIGNRWLVEKKPHGRSWQLKATLLENAGAEPPADDSPAE